MRFNAKLKKTYKVAGDRTRVAKSSFQKRPNKLSQKAKRNKTKPTYCFFLYYRLKFKVKTKKKVIAFSQCAKTRFSSQF